jgi:segregation and condensation protein B
MEEQISTEKLLLKIPTTLKALVEALIFAAKEPLSINQIRSIYQNENPQEEDLRFIEPETIRQIVIDLNKEYQTQDRSYRIVQIAGGYQFATLSEYAGWLGKLYKEQARRKLSQSGLETLSIIAYKQPVTKAEIEKIRGVNCDYVLKALLEKELVTVTGRADSVGRPLLYGTTKEFLKHFGLNDITDLPRPREIEEILGESQFETERRMLEAQAGAELMKKEQEEYKSRLPHIPKKRPDLDEKGVEIVPHEKIQEIRIVSIEEQDKIEEPSQETIDFPPIRSVENKNLELDHPLSTLHKIKTSDEIQQPQPLQIGEEVSISSKEEPINSNAGNTHDNIDIEKVTSSTQEIITQNIEQSTTQVNDVQKPNRWQVWKEKIQKFIKRLFV